MLRYFVFVALFSFTEWLSASSSFSAGNCPVKKVKPPMCALQKKLYVDLGLSKTLRANLSADHIQIVKDKDIEINFGFYPAHRELDIFPDTLQIGIGYAWLRNSAYGELSPYMSVGMEYRQIDAVNYPLTLTGKVFGSRDEQEVTGSAEYKSILLQNSHLFATIKVNPIKIGCVFPYVSAGLGVSWTHAYNQQLRGAVTDKKIAGSVQLPAIKQANVGFRLGSGFDFALTQNLFMGIGYSYNYLGKLTVSKLSAEIEIPADKRKDVDAILKNFRALHLGSLTTHNVEFSLRYLFA